MSKTKLPATVLIMAYSIMLNLSLQAQVSNWSYIRVDDEKSKWGDYDQPNWLRYFGLDMGDLNNDGLKDIMTGRWVYLNPGGDMTGEWKKTDMGINVDGILVMDVDGDEYGDVIAQALPNVYWLEAKDQSGNEWKCR
jgi:hypothetical protein